MEVHISFVCSSRWYCQLGNFVRVLLTLPWSVVNCCTYSVVDLMDIVVLAVVRQTVFDASFRDKRIPHIAAQYGWYLGRLADLKWI